MTEHPRAEKVEKITVPKGQKRVSKPQHPATKTAKTAFPKPKFRCFVSIHHFCGSFAVICSRILRRKKEIRYIVGVLFFDGEDRFDKAACCRILFAKIIDHFAVG